jgi:hypothetical protein
VGRWKKEQLIDCTSLARTSATFQKVTQPRADSLSKLQSVLSELQLKGGEKKLGEGAERGFER